MKKLKASIIVSFVMAVAGSAFAIPPPVVILPEGTPDRVDNYDSRNMYSAYRLSVGKDIERGSTAALNNVRILSRGLMGSPDLRRHGVSFSYNPASKSDATEKVQGRVYRSCWGEDGCDWVMVIVTVPEIDAQGWADKHFDAATAAASLNDQNIMSNNAVFYLGYLMNLPSPKKYILENAKEQLYFGKECPEFVEVLAAEAFGQERADALLSVSTSGEEASAATQVEGAVFDISIVETADEFENSRTPTTIDMKFSGTRGDAVGNKLVESIKGCKNKAGRYN